MEELQTRLRKFYFCTIVPSVAVFGILFAIFRDASPLTSPDATYYIMIVLLGLCFFGVAASSLYLRRSSSLREDAEGLTEPGRYEKAYRIRIITFALLSVLSSIAYAITHEQNTIYLVGIMTLLALLSYPTRSFVMKK